MPREGLRCRPPRPHVLLLLLGAALSGCAAEREETRSIAGLRLEAGAAPRGIVLIVNDAMRRDRVGVYGGPARTPAFDGLARSGIRFDRASTQAPWTKPSIATLFTSLYPSQHGVLTHPRLRTGHDPGSTGQDAKAPVRMLQADILGQDFATLAESLRAQGFRTAAFVGNPWLLRGFGFDQGFETYDDSFAGWGIPGEAISRAALAWLATLRGNERFFVYLHYLDSHRPYHRFAADEIQEAKRVSGADDRALPPRIRDEIGRFLLLQDLRPAIEAGIRPSLGLLDLAYDRGIEDFDRALGLFLATMRQHEAWPSTAIIVTSDHGEALYTRGYGNHGDGLYEDETAIPLAARIPGVTVPEGRLAAPVGLVDLMPTLCTLARVRCPDHLSGVDLLRPAGGAETLLDRYLLTEGVMHKPGNRAIHHGPYKLLWQPQKGFDLSMNALFDIAADPGERRNLLAEGDRGRTGEEILADLLRGGRDAAPSLQRAEPEQAPIDPEVERRLRALGYIGG